MDIGKLNVDGEWVELKTENEKFGILKVKVVPNPYDSIIDVASSSLSALINRLVVDWNLEKGGKKLPFTDENKRKYLPVISSWRVKNPKHSSKNLKYKSVGSEIIAFSQDVDNFTKN